MHSIFEKLLPTGVKVGTETTHHKIKDLYIGGAGLNNAVVSYLKHGEHTPLTDITFVIGIQGRGSLNILGSEFMDLLATMVAQTKAIAGLDQPIPVEFEDADGEAGAPAAEQSA